MDINKFLSSEFSAREADVAVPSLKPFFDKGEKLVWRVRGLTAAELGRAREAKDRTETMQAMVKAMSGDGDKAAAIREAMGLKDGEVPQDVSQRIEMLALGSVNPAISPEQRDIAVKLAEAYPVTFFQLTNKIHELTGAGAELGKPKRSGKTQK